MKSKSGLSFGFPVFRILIVIFLLSIGSSAVFAEFAPKTDLFSADKDTPLGFTNLVEPNVLLLIDTSGSMAFKMENNVSTNGDGSKPYLRGGTTYRYFGNDNNPGNNNDDNNDPSVDFNYHPLLREVPPEEIARTDGSYRTYLSYSLGYSWTNVAPQNSGNTGLPTGYRWSNRNLQKNMGGNNWQNVTPGDQSQLPSGYRWELSGNTWVLQRWAENGEYIYRYPNDSRLYILRNVMYRILSDSTLVDNLRIGLASYFQTYTLTRDTSTYYYNKGTQQSISWRGSLSSAIRRRGLLRRDFRSTTSALGHLDKLKEWFDGREDDNNPEFRAHGATPLANSIFNADNTANLSGVSNEGSRQGSAADFFTMDDPHVPGKKVISDWCQDNWLIVLTDGADSYVNAANTALAARSLYNTSITVNGQPSRPIKTFVVGMIDPEELTTLRNTLNNMADYGDDGLLNGSATAYFPQNMQELFDAFKEIFQTIQDFASTGSAPLVNPPKAAGGQGKAYSTGFKPKSDQQWTGYLYSYTISDDVLSTTPNWEAGAKLNTTAHTARQIYTADWGGSTASSLSGSNLKNFLSTQVEALRPLLAGPITTTVLPNTKLAQFINWVRGLDVWDESEGSERWKLGDPYHVGLVEVGAPQSLLKDQAYRTFAETYKNRGKFIYLHANDGMVHSFASETSSVTVPQTTEGLEKWAFIPPNVLGYRRLLGLKVDADGSWLTNEKYSVPKYLLDGPLIAEDVYFGGAYRTVMLGSLGRAGAGMYALDITDPSVPKFLWALENNYYDQATMAVRPVDDRTFLRWASSGGPATSVLSTVAASDSSALGRLRLTVSTPFIGTVDINNPSGTDVITKWVSLFGAGAQYAYSDTDTDGGKAVYVIDIENGARIKELTHADLGMAVAPLSIETGPRPLRIKTFYLGDHKGAVFEGDASAASTDNWTLQRVFTPGTVTPSTVVGIPYAVEIGIIKNRKWLFWGTGDPDGLFGTQTGQNYIVALNRNTGGPNTTYTDLEGLNRDNVDSVAQTLNGWYLPLTSTETVTTPPVLYKGYIFIATYAPILNDNCAIGKSHFYILKADTGLGGWIDPSGNENKYVTLDATRISGITVSGGKLYVGVTRYPGASNPPAVMGNVTLSGNLMVIDVPDHIKNSEDDIPSKSTRPTYWRDWKP